MGTNIAEDFIRLSSAKSIACEASVAIVAKMKGEAIAHNNGRHNDVPGPSTNKCAFLTVS